jgi:ketosteroid isomerase-like protein
MNTLGRLTSVPLLFLAAAFVVPDSIGRAQQPSDRDVIKAAIEAFDTALSTRDMRGVEQAWVHDAYVAVVSPRDKSFSLGWDAVRNHYQDVFDFWSYLKVSLERQPQIHVNQDTAWAISMQSATGQTKTGEPLFFSTLVTDVFEKREGRWLMVSHHSSRVPD